MSAKTVFLETAPFLLVKDVIASAEHYRDRLGFSIGRYFGEPPAFVIVKRNATRIMLRQGVEDAERKLRSNAEVFAEAIDLYVWVSDIDALADELRKSGAEILDVPNDSDTWRREMIVRDLNGYRLCFGQVTGWPD